eukprot:Phypoly_transcript_09332.p2 GENE.Phypoly_transcript_09332~~Phypoly_transcript_09332.p2  ORF type:complete len:145 (+),score=6.62 Phypoly_transcript_09332:515-949(+)
MVRFPLCIYLIFSPYISPPLGNSPPVSLILRSPVLASPTEGPVRSMVRPLPCLLSIFFSYLQLSLRLHFSASRVLLWQLFSYTLGFNTSVSCALSPGLQLSIYVLTLYTPPLFRLTLFSKFFTSPTVLTLSPPNTSNFITLQHF